MIFFPFSSSSSCNDFSTEIFHFFPDIYFFCSWLDQIWFSTDGTMEMENCLYRNSVVGGSTLLKSVYLLVKTERREFLFFLFHQPTESILNVTVAVKWSSNNHKFLELFSIVIIFSIKLTTSFHCTLYCRCCCCCWCCFYLNGTDVL